MADILSKVDYPKALITDLIDKVKGASVLQKLSAQEPIPFNGTTQFDFTFDKDVDIVAENGEKGVGGVTMAPITIVPIKFEYGARFSEESWFASEEAQVDILKAFNDGFSKKLAKGLDLAAIHGVNPRTRATSTIVGNNHFMNAAITKVDTANLTKPDEYLDLAINTVTGNEYENTGIAMSAGLASSMGREKSTSGTPLYPDFMFGGYPQTLAGKTLAVSTNISAVKVENTTPEAIVGDFSMFKWGFARNIDLRMIQYGDPDGQGDLSRKNQVYLRAEAYIGWAIMDPKAFAVVTLTKA